MGWRKKWLRARFRMLGPQFYRKIQIERNSSSLRLIGQMLTVVGALLLVLLL